MSRKSLIPSLIISLAAVAIPAGAQTVTEYAIPTANSDPLRITLGPDGNLWFTEFAVHKIGRITPAGVITEFPIPNSPSYPTGICAGPDANLWFTGIRFPGMIRRITTSGVFLPAFPINPSGYGSAGIAPGADGNLWFGESNVNKIVRMTTGGAYVEFPVPAGSSAPTAIAAGPDGALWFTEQAADKIGRVTTAGVVTDFPIPTPNSVPRDIAAGADGNLWFTEAATAIDTIGRITTAGVITEFLLPSLRGVNFIAAGPDGNLWFTEPHAFTSQIGRITPGGVVTEYLTLSGDAQPAGITAGPDGAMWFVEPGANKIGRITVPTGNPAITFNTLPPCRVADTRDPDGPWGGPPLVAGANRTFVLSGKCGIPPTATAVSFNFTITAPTASGYIRIFPAQPSLPDVSSLSWSAGQTRANNGVLGLGPAHDIEVHVDQAFGTVHFVIDINGYFQ